MRLTACLSLCLLCLSIATGCAEKGEWDQFWNKMKQDKGEQPIANPMLPSNSKALHGTIGELVTISGTQLLQVRGFGLVVGLVDTGGGDGPETVKNYVIKEIRRLQEIGEPGIPAGEVLAGRDAAMVEVTGFVPAAAQKGDRFDVVIRALGTQAKSLVGGRLVFADLKLWAQSPQGVIEGKTIAIASGPIFVSPFDRAGRASSKIDLRTGMVFAGGITKEPRQIKLVLNDPRYSIARQIMTRINGRYAGADPLADAKSPSSVDLKIPPQARQRKALYLEHILHTTLNPAETFLKQRAQDLGEEISSPDAEFESIGLAWDAIGKIILPTVRDHYHDELPAAAYYSGRTGMRMGDTAGMQIVAKHAADPRSEFRKQAIEELGFTTNMHAAGEALRKLLDDPDDDIRIRAYQSLRRHAHPAIETRVLDQDNLVLDIIDSGGEFLIYVQRLNEPRIAVFGKQMACNPPAIFPGDRNDSRRLLTQISANKGDDHLTLIYRNKFTGKNSPQLEAPLNVGKLITFLGDRWDTDPNGKPTGLAVPYSEVVDILHALCKPKSISARFIVEEMTVPEADADGGKQREESEY